jgi:hypothetical protein
MGRVSRERAVSRYREETVFKRLIAAYEQAGVAVQP